MILNAKKDRPSACNALDTLLVHKDVAAQLFSRLVTLFNQHKLNVVAASSALPYLDGVEQLREAQAGDFDTEWLGPTLGVAVVDDVDQALAHMRTHNASHSDAILTNDLQSAEALSTVPDRRLCMSMHQRVLPMVRSLVLALKWRYPLKSSMPAVRWDSKS